MTVDRPDAAASNSFGQILRSSSIFGGASVINVLIGIARLKVAALLLGPAGVGLIGLFQNVIAAGSSAASLGIGASATRQLAAHPADRDPVFFVAVRRGIVSLAIVLALLGTLGFLALRDRLAASVFGDPGLSSSLGWLSLGIGLGVASAAQGGMLIGLRRVGDSARVMVLSAVVSGMFGIAILLLLGERGIIPFVLLPSITAVIAGAYYVARLPPSPKVPVSFRAVVEQWRALSSIGIAFMFGGLVLLLAQLAVRTIVQRELGLVELGYLQATWAISITYVGFVLQSMGADYAPRLAAVATDAPAANRLINEQTEVALLLSGPLILLTLGAAPWILELFYSGAFRSAADLLRWQILGDLLKIASWPLGFLLIARGDGRTYIITESSASLLFVAIAAVSVPRFGVEAAGVATLGLYMFYLPTVYWLAVRRTSFSWSAEVKRTLGLLAAGCVFIFAVSHFSELGATAVAVILSTIAASFAFRRLRHAMPAPIARLFSGP